MNTPKLPPLPEPNLVADPCDANGTQTNYYTEATVMRLLAAIEAQGVPDAQADVAQQAKPHPLSDEQKQEIIKAHAGYGGDDFLSVIAAVERHYGIKE